MTLTSLNYHDLRVLQSPSPRYFALKPIFRENFLGHSEDILGISNFGDHSKSQDVVLTHAVQHPRALWFGAGPVTVVAWRYNL